MYTSSTPSERSVQANNAEFFAFAMFKIARLWSRDYMDVEAWDTGVRPHFLHICMSSDLIQPKPFTLCESASKCMCPPHLMNGAHVQQGPCCEATAITYDLLNRFKLRNHRRYRATYPDVKVQPVCKIQTPKQSPYARKEATKVTPNSTKHDKKLTKITKGLQEVCSLLNSQLC